MLRGLPTIAGIVAIGSFASSLAFAQAHDHSKMADGMRKGCAEATLACATSATPTVAPDGSLWLAFAAGGKVSVARSSDFGKTFSTAVAVAAEPVRLDTGPDARPSIVVDRQGRVVVAYPIFKDAAFNGQVLYTRSTDGGRSFATPRAITGNPESQRFEAIALDADGSLFAAWLDKRNRAKMPKGEKYIGAALAFSWSSDGGATFSEARLAQDNTCECCRLGVAFTGPGQPVVIFRNVFDNGKVRDHAVMTFANKDTPGPLHRVAVDDWAIEACPHHGPSLSIAPEGAYHATWFTMGRARKGLFYAHSEDGGATFSAPMAIGRRDRSPSRPYVLAVPGAVWLAWKEFDGEKSTIVAMASHDGGTAWTEPAVVAGTADKSDHPLLIAKDGRAYLSWLTTAEGYRLLPLEEHTQ